MNGSTKLEGGPAASATELDEKQQNDVAKERLEDKKRNVSDRGVSVSTRQVDTAAKLLAAMETDGEVNPAESLRVR